MRGGQRPRSLEAGATLCRRELRAVLRGGSHALGGARRLPAAERESRSMMAASNDPQAASRSTTPFGAAGERGVLSWTGGVSASTAGKLDELLAGTRYRSLVLVGLLHRGRQSSWRPLLSYYRTTILPSSSLLVDTSNSRVTQCRRRELACVLGRLSLARSRAFTYTRHPPPSARPPTTVRPKRDDVFPGGPFVSGRVRV